MILFNIYCLSLMCFGIILLPDFYLSVVFLCVLTNDDVEFLWKIKQENVI
ncbi:hypothetical protein NGUA41_02115 [Salmonella enterica]|nr:hypothetical protein NGUA40_04631 [Salmonella enterica]GAS77256.1 hypothetical protein NGUA41_02115 [Salmonella enterica]